MEYKKVIKYLLKGRVQIEFFEKSFIETFYFFFLLFLFYKFVTYFLKIEKKKKINRQSFNYNSFFSIIVNIYYPNNYIRIQ